MGCAAQAGGGERAYKLLPAKIRANPAVFEAVLPDHSPAWTRALACVPELMGAALDAVSAGPSPHDL